jgi:hypothetical protein
MKHLTKKQKHAHNKTKQKKKTRTRTKHQHKNKNKAIKKNSGHHGRWFNTLVSRMWHKRRKRGDIGCMWTGHAAALFRGVG